MGDPKQADFTFFVMQTLKEQKEIRLKTKGASMLPAITEGKVVRVVSPSSRKLKVGQVIAFRDGKNLIAHRLVGIKKNKYITQEDNTDRSQGEVWQKVVSKKDIVGILLDIK